MDKHYNDYVQIGLNIMRYRKEAGYTQLQLAEMTGYSHQHIQRVETASSKPTVGLLLDVSQALHVPIERLLEIRPVKYSENPAWVLFFTFTPHADSSPSFCLWRQHRTSRWPPAPQ